MSELFSQQDVRKALREALGDFRSEAEMARAIGVSRAHLNRVVRGEKPPDGKIAKWLGFKRIIAYVDTP